MCILNIAGASLNSYSRTEHDSIMGLWKINYDVHDCEIYIHLRALYSRTLFMHALYASEVFNEVAEFNLSELPLSLIGVLTKAMSMLHSIIYFIRCVEDVNKTLYSDIRRCRIRPNLHTYPTQ